jgi:hypothetical protein
MGWDYVYGRTIGMGMGVIDRVDIPWKAFGFCIQLYRLQRYPYSCIEIWSQLLSTINMRF